ncbi:hypothetical protein IE53DRAFT_243166 [Violaceomyces palustris]|uniref:Uncharacterized protein n=1 Tax=Violaceomyces palustris TaxID=1673888 RepID=A0ACD0P427_9BASI|nr:hypothetical protein IE53DRAFT_243166 [Violaceomyces palustris]
MPWDSANQPQSLHPPPSHTCSVSSPSFLFLYLFSSPSDEAQGQRSGSLFSIAPSEIWLPIYRPVLYPDFPFLFLFVLHFASLLLNQSVDPVHPPCPLISPELFDDTFVLYGSCGLPRTVLYSPYSMYVQYMYRQ